MLILDSIEALRAWRARCEGRVGFVPTMGYLHEGHQALMREAVSRAEHVVASVYVNPTQFGPNEDLDAYPRDLQGDIARCEQAGCEALFTPSDAMMYPAGFATQVRVTGLTEHLCGAHREGHFDGVALVVAKLFNLVRPDVAVFGEKDYQQLAVIRRMVSDLNFDLEVVGVPTVREPDGLARSSRNRYLVGEDRQRATLLSRTLANAWHAWAAGERRPEVLLEQARRHLLSDDHVVLDYVELVDPLTLDPLPDPATATARGAVMALAARVGPARLIDNLRLDAPALPEALRRDTSAPSTP